MNGLWIRIHTLLAGLLFIPLEFDIPLYDEEGRKEGTPILQVFVLAE